MEKEKLFSLVALVCIIFFYSIPSSKRSVYLMPAYPFIAIFLAQYTLYITEYRTKVTRVFAAFMASITAVVMIAVALTMAGAIDPVKIASQTQATNRHWKWSSWYRICSHIPAD